MDETIFNKMVQAQQRAAALAFCLRVVLHLHRIRDITPCGGMQIDKSLIQSLLTQLAAELVGQKFAALAPLKQEESQRNTAHQYQQNNPH